MASMDNHPFVKRVKAQPGQTAPSGLRPGTSLDWFLNGKIAVIQPDIGARAGLDAVLLAASLQTSDAGENTFMEAGCGSGAALLCAAQRLTTAAFVGIDTDPEAIERAKKSIERAGMENRVRVSHGTVTDRSAHRENACAQAFANPPFFSPGRTTAVHPARSQASIAHSPLSDWLNFLLHVTRPGGMMTLIHRAHSLADILGHLGPRAGQIAILPVFPAPLSPAKRVLVRARKGLQRGDITLHRGLVLHREKGGPLTESARNIAQGGPLDWQ